MGQTKKISQQSLNLSQPIKRSFSVISVGSVRGLLFVCFHLCGSVAKSNRPYFFLCDFRISREAQLIGINWAVTKNEAYLLKAEDYKVTLASRLGWIAR